jgi:hypothetical protein
MKTKTVRSKIVAAVEGPITSRQASLLDQRFTELRTKFGKLTADLVWRDGQNRKSPLFKFFAHDAATIAKEYGMARARYLIRQVAVVYMKDSVVYPKTRGWVKVKHTSEYAPMKEILTNADLRQQYLDEALADLESWQKRYRTVSELSGVFALIDRAIAHIRQTKEQKKKSKAAAA